MRQSAEITEAPPAPFLVEVF